MTQSDVKRALVLSARKQRAAALVSILEDNGWSVRLVGSAEELLSTPVDWEGVIFVDYEDLSRRWTSALHFAQTRTPASQVVVYSRLADEHLWAEVLCLGGYDVISEPFETDEVLRVADSGWRGMLDYRPQYAA